MRLGEKLVQDQLITALQLEMALRAQVIYGGRLGTNLVELDYLGLDALSRTLAEVRGVPAALESNFDGVDAATIGLIPARLAEKHQAIPLALSRLSGRQLVVAFVDPSKQSAIEELAFLTGSRIKPCVAPELRVFRYLEKLYGIPRKNRYLRIDRRGAERARPPAVALGPPPADERRRYVLVGEPAGAIPGSARDTADPILPRAGSLPHVSVGTIGPAQIVSSPALRDASTSNQSALAGSAPSPRPAISLAEALERIEAATTRDDVGDAIVDYLRSRYGCGILFVAKEGVALGWKGFAPGSPADTIESLALPLTAPSMLRLAHDGRAVFRGLPPSDGAPIQQRLWRSLRVVAPTEVLVAPIVLKDRVVAVVYCHALDGRNLPDESGPEIASLCSTSATAFARLIHRSKHR